MNYAYPPVYSFPKGKKGNIYFLKDWIIEETIKINSPGPTKYNPKDSYRSQEPKWTVGSEKRFLENEYDTPNPGPGSHTIESKFESKTTFGVRLNYSTNNFPGPGQYSPDYDHLYAKIKYSYIL